MNIIEEYNILYYILVALCTMPNYVSCLNPKLSFSFATSNVQIVILKRKLSSYNTFSYV